MLRGSEVALVMRGPEVDLLLKGREVASMTRGPEIDLMLMGPEVVLVMRGPDVALAVDPVVLVEVLQVLFVALLLFVIDVF